MHSIPLSKAITAARMDELRGKRQERSHELVLLTPSAVRAVGVISNRTVNQISPSHFHPCHHLHSSAPAKPIMSTIDHLAFPHIVDLIHDFAPFNSLSVLRRVCPEWRQRVDTRIHHLRNFSLFHHHFCRFQLDSGELVTTLKLPYLFKRKVVDLDPNVSAPACKHVHPFDTVRVPRSNKATISTPLALSYFECSRLVLDNHFGLNTSNSINKLVINYYGSDQKEDFLFQILGRECSAPTFSVQHVVFVVHSAGSADKGRWRRAVNTGEYVFVSDD